MDLVLVRYLQISKENKKVDLVSQMPLKAYPQRPKDLLLFRGSHLLIAPLWDQSSNTGALGGYISDPNYSI